MNYKDKLYSKYSSTHTAGLYGVKRKEDIEAQFPVWDSYFGQFLPEEKDVEILDAGAGNGGFVHYLKSRGYKNVLGVDISEERVTEAKKLGIKEVEEGDLFKFLPERKNKFDLVFARDVLEHFPKENLPELLEEVLGSLKEGGIFVIQTVNAENLLWGRLRHGDFTHDLAFTKESVRQVLSFAGFKKIHIFPQRPVAHGFVSGVRLALWSILEVLLSLYLLIETGSSRGIFTQNLIVAAEK